MKVILLADIKGVGKKEQIIEASDGYAINFLFPKKLALEASKANLAVLDAKNRNIEMKRQSDLEAARALKAKLEALLLKLVVKTGEKGKLFGSVTNAEISEALVSQYSIDIDKKKIVISDPIKSVGEKTVEVKILNDINAKLKINVTDK